MRTTKSVPVASEPVPAWAERGERWLRYDSVVRQSFIVLAVMVLGLSLIDPPAGTGWAVTAYVLVVLNTLVAAVRLVPAIFTDERRLLAVYVVGAVLVGVTVALDRSNATSTFGYFLAGNAGFRLVSGRALGVAVWTAVCVTAGLVVGHVQGWTVVPWYIGPLVFLPVLIGIANRSRTQAEVATREAARARVETVQAEARAAASAERARVARDVHDVLAHSLAGINMQLEVVDVLLENGDGEGARAAAAKAQQQVREGMAEVSRTVHALRQDALPLVDTLSALVDTAAPAGTSLAVVGDRRELPTPAATALARVAQESLTNAHKHAPGATVAVTLTFSPGTTALDIANGAPTRAAELTGTGSGMGLVGMRERVEIVGGRVRTGPVTDGDLAGGWRVHVEVPA